MIDYRNARYNAGAFVPRALVENCIAHLAEEALALDAVLNSLRAVRLALLQRANPRLAEVLNEQRHVVAEAGRLKLARQQLRIQIADALGVPPAQASLRMLASHADEQSRSQLLHWRRQLSERAVEVELLSRANAALVLQSIDLLRQVFEWLTGEVSSNRYDESGKPSGDSQGSFMQREY